MVFSADLCESSVPASAVSIAEKIIHQRGAEATLSTTEFVFSKVCLKPGVNETKSRPRREGFFEECTR